MNSNAYLIGNGAWEDRNQEMEETMKKMNKNKCQGCGEWPELCCCWSEAQKPVRCLAKGCNETAGGGCYCIHHEDIYILDKIDRTPPERYTHEDYDMEEN